MTFKHWGKWPREDAASLVLETSKICLGNAGSSLIDLQNWPILWEGGQRRMAPDDLQRS